MRIGGLGALLTTGRLPDHLGRRVVLAAGLVVEAAAMLVFVLAGDVTALYIGRILAAAGIGIAAGAVSAWLLDLSPPSDPGLGSLVGGAGPLLGLGGGALLGGVLVEYGPDPLHLVFWLLAAAYAAGLLVISAIPDPVLRRPGWVASLRPTVDVPAAARPIFLGGLPAVIGCGLSRACTCRSVRRSRRSCSPRTAGRREASSSSPWQVPAQSPPWWSAPANRTGSWWADQYW